MFPTPTQSVTSAEEHEQLIKALKAPEWQREAKTNRRRNDQMLGTRMVEAQGAIPWFLIPGIDHVILSGEWKKAPWNNSSVGALRQRTPSGLRYRVGGFGQCDERGIWE